MGVPLNHPFPDGIFPNKHHPFGDTPMTMETPDSHVMSRGASVAMALPSIFTGLHNMSIRKMKVTTLKICCWD